VFFLLLLDHTARKSSGCLNLREKTVTFDPEYSAGPEISERLKDNF
jgi:hypothetical protein